MIEKLLRAAAWYRPVIERVPGFVQILTHDNVYIDFKPHDLNRLWLPLGAHAGKQLQEVLPDELLLPRLHYLNLARCSGRTQRYNQKYLNPNGVWRDYQIVVTPLRSEMIVVVRDRQEAEVPYTIFIH